MALMLSEAHAALYVGLSPADFRMAVALGELPSAVRLAGQILWLRTGIERALESGPDGLAGLSHTDALSDPLLDAIERMEPHG